ncbi:MAG: hypothetical protein HY372_02370 [Candidatus Andersenbacteria bacterium]|nr:hypothetical protein [Candidatus Andersenbacteria bacterium]
MEPYRVKTPPLAGTRYADITPPARRLLKNIQRRTKRRPYIRSAFFKKEKVFIVYFWDHLLQLPRYQRTRRLKYLPCAIELIQKSRQAPKRYLKRDQPQEVFYRFSGRAPNGVAFAVQVKERRKTGRKELMSVFPYI